MGVERSEARCVPLFLETARLASKVSFESSGCTLVRVGGRR